MRSSEVYNFIGITSLGYYSGYSLGSIPGVNTWFGERIIVGLVLEGKYVAYMGSYDGVRGKEDLGIISGKI